MSSRQKRWGKPFSPPSCPALIKRLPVLRPLAVNVGNKTETIRPLLKAASSPAQGKHYPRMPFQSTGPIPTGVAPQGHTYVKSEDRHVHSRAMEQAEKSQGSGGPGVGPGGRWEPGPQAGLCTDRMFPRRLVRSPFLTACVQGVSGQMTQSPPAPRFSKSMSVSVKEPVVREAGGSGKVSPRSLWRSGASLSRAQINCFPAQLNPAPGFSSHISLPLQPVPRFRGPSRLPLPTRKNKGTSTQRPSENPLICFPLLSLR